MAHYARGRGSVTREPRVVYLDGVTDEFREALSPRIEYHIEGDRVQLRIRLVRQERVVAERRLSQPNTSRLSQGIADEVIRMAEALVK